MPKTPYEMWFRKTRSYKYLRIWGCPTNVKKTVGDKLDSRSIKCKFVEYPKELIGYYFYHPLEQKVFVSRNATFLENEFLLDGNNGNMINLEEIQESQTTIPQQVEAKNIIESQST